MDTGDGQAALDRHLAMALVDGVAVRTSWQTLEPARRSYDWTAVDVADDAAARHGKKWGLHIIGAVFAAPPAWLTGQGMQT
jgi:beta-galactosidase GanA